MVVTFGSHGVTALSINFVPYYGPISARCIGYVLPVFSGTKRIIRVGFINLVGSHFIRLQ